ncbi:MAG: recombinase RecT [Oscillospiraceae bacterium]|nr:recombinase RecT [Oscillospiraceae bacterium]
MARLNNSLAPTGSGAIDKQEKFSVAIQGSTLQSMIKKATPDAQSAARLTGSLISLVASSTELQNCNPASIVAAALRGEGMGLMLGMGYYVVPYAGTASFQLGYKGLIQMAMAGGDVADMDCVEIRDGEYVGRDRRTKRPEFDFSIYATDEEAEKHPIIGYYAYVEKRDGFFRSEYMSIGAILDHAEQYSKTFDRSKYRQLISGDLSPDEAERLKKKSPWYSATETMMKKTVIRRLLNSGYVQLRAITNIETVLTQEDEEAKDAEALASFDVVNVDPSTGEIKEQSVQVNPSDTEGTVDGETSVEADQQSKKGRGRPKKDGGEPVAQDVAFEPVKEAVTIKPDDEEEVLGSFFA